MTLSATLLASCQVACRWPDVLHLLVTSLSSSRFAVCCRIFATRELVFNLHRNVPLPSCCCPTHSLSERIDVIVWKHCTLVVPRFVSSVLQRDVWELEGWLEECVLITPKCLVSMQVVPFTRLWRRLWNRSNRTCFHRSSRPIITLYQL